MQKVDDAMVNANDNDVQTKQFKMSFFYTHTQKKSQHHLIRKRKTLNQSTLHLSMLYAVVDSIKYNSEYGNNVHNGK